MSEYTFKNIDAVVFDIGGVLIELRSKEVFDIWSHYSGTPADLIQSRWSLDNEFKLHETGKISFSTYCEHLSRLLQIQMNQQQWAEGWNALVGDPFPKVSALLPQLGKLLPMYCLTNSNPLHEATWIQQSGRAFSDITEVFNSSTIGLRKPNLEAFEYVINKIQVDPSRTLFLDDHQENVHAAQWVGMQARHVAGELQVSTVIEQLTKSLRLTF